MDRRSDFVLDRDFPGVSPCASIDARKDPLSRSCDNGDSAVVLNLDNNFFAYRNACAHQGLPLDGGMVDVEAGTLTCPWHGFCFDARSGECFTAPAAQLEPLPLRVDKDKVWVRFVRRTSLPSPKKLVLFNISEHSPDFTLPLES